MRYFHFTGARRIYTEISDHQLLGANVRPKGWTSLAQPHSGDPRAFYIKLDKMDREQKKKKSNMLPLWLSGKESACNAGDIGLNAGSG